MTNPATGVQWPLRAGPKKQNREFNEFTISAKQAIFARPFHVGKAFPGKPAHDPEPKRSGQSRKEAARAEKTACHQESIKNGRPGPQSPAMASPTQPACLQYHQTMASKNSNQPKTNPAAIANNQGRGTGGSTANGSFA